MTHAALAADLGATESSLQDYITLMKPGVLSLVVFTGLAGIVAAPAGMHPFLILVTLLCIALGSAGGAALNMWYDRDIDAVMARTVRRPVPAGRITPGNALAFGMVLSITSVALLGLAANIAAALMLAFAIFFYAVIYTMLLKRRTPQNIVIGGAAGAFPPVIGWMAVTGSMDAYPCVLFLITFLWTPPHFWALALYRSGDYARAGVPMLPVTHGGEETRRQIIIYTYLLVLATMLPVFMQQAGLLYALAALAGGYGFLRRAQRLRHMPSDSRARSLFGYSIAYLFIIFGALMLDRCVDRLVHHALNYGFAG